MKLLEEIIDRVNAGGISGEWATQSQVAASSAVDKLELPAIPDDAVVDLVGCLLDEIERLRALLDCRAGKLLRKGKFFLVVANDEPYFTHVYTLIRDNEKRHGRWTDADEGMWLREHGGRWVPRSQEEDNNHER